MTSFTDRARLDVGVRESPLPEALNLVDWYVLHAWRSASRSADLARKPLRLADVVAVRTPPDQLRCVVDTFRPEDFGRVGVGKPGSALGAELRPVGQDTCPARRSHRVDRSVGRDSEQLSPHLARIGPRREQWVVGQFDSSSSTSWVSRPRVGRDPAAIAGVIWPPPLPLSVWCGPAEVVVHEVQRHRVGVVLDLLAEPVGQPGEPAHPHPHREVLTLDIAGPDERLVGVAARSCASRSLVHVARACNGGLPRPVAPL